jgi:hypothetical protein
MSVMAIFRQSATLIMLHRVSCAAMKTAALMLLLCAANLASSQQLNTKAAKDSTLAQTAKLLGMFSGTWSITVVYDPSDSMPQGGTGSGQEIWHAGPGERSVIEEYRSTTSTGFGLGWWEEESAGFRLNWCSDNDPHGCKRLSEVATWQANTWVVRHTGSENGQDFEFKEVFSDITSNSFTQTLYKGPPGKLRRFLTIKATRVK